MSSGLVALGPTEFSARQNTACRLSLKPWRGHGQRPRSQRRPGRSSPTHRAPKPTDGQGYGEQSWHWATRPRLRLSGEPWSPPLEPVGRGGEPSSWAGLRARILALPLTRGTSWPLPASGQRPNRTALLSPTPPVTGGVHSQTLCGSRSQGEQQRRGGPAVRALQSTSPWAGPPTSSGCSPQRSRQTAPTAGPVPPRVPLTSSATEPAGPGVGRGAGGSSRELPPRLGGQCLVGHLCPASEGTGRRSRAPAAASPAGLAEGLWLVAVLETEPRGLAGA